MKKTIHALALLLVAGPYAAHADTFGTGADQFTLDFTAIGNAGQATDTTGYGSVAYSYSIGTYDVSVAQLNAATANGAVGLPSGYWSGTQPAVNVSWNEAAAFVNWLNTSKGHQAAYNLTYSGGAYTMALWQSGQNGYDASNPYRNSLALYILPSENEFYKAAYGKSDGSGYFVYTTASDSAPTAVASGTTAGTAVYGNVGTQPASVYAAGGLSSYGTMGQGGNMWQWMETAYDGVNNAPDKEHAIRGSSWNGGVETSASTFRMTSDPNANIGFRVAAVPEPSTYALFGIGAIGMLMVIRRRKTA